MSEVKTKTPEQGAAGEYTPTRRLFTVEDYYRMVDAGILREDERVELIKGEILVMAPIGSKHMYSVNEFTERFVVALAGRAIVSPQNSVRLSMRSQPQPDLALLRPRRDRYYFGVPAPEDVFLVVEVSDTTLSYDRDTKLPLYAEWGVPEVWIVNLTGRSIIVARDPSEAGYRHVETVPDGGTVSPAAFPDIVLPVHDLVAVDVEPRSPETR
jgi:Uma2 family endonuclease